MAFLIPDGQSISDSKEKNNPPNLTTSLLLHNPNNVVACYGAQLFHSSLWSERKLLWTMADLSQRMSSPMQSLTKNDVLTG